VQEHLRLAPAPLRGRRGALQLLVEAREDARAVVVEAPVERALRGAVPAQQQRGRDEHRLLKQRRAARRAAQHVAQHGHDGRDRDEAGLHRDHGLAPVSPVLGSPRHRGRREVVVFHLNQLAQDRQRLQRTARVLMP
jgi:hypothetical protein